MKTEVKTINISKETKNKLLALMGESSPRKAVRKLLDLSEKPSEVILSDRNHTTNIRLDLETHSRLNDYRKYDNETNTQLIDRLIREMID